MPVTNALLIRTAYGWDEAVAQASIDARGRREAMYALGANDNDTAVQAVAAKRLDIISMPRYQYDAEHVPVTLAELAYHAFGTTDMLQLTTALGVASEAVVAIAASEDDVGHATVTLSLNDLILWASPIENFVALLSQAAKKMIPGTGRGDWKEAQPVTPPAVPQPVGVIAAGSCLTDGFDHSDRDILAGSDIDYITEGFIQVAPVSYSFVGGPVTGGHTWRYFSQSVGPRSPGIQDANLIGSGLGITSDVFTTRAPASPLGTAWNSLPYFDTAHWAGVYDSFDASAASPTEIVQIAGTKELLSSPDMLVKATVPGVTSDTNYDVEWNLTARGNNDPATWCTNSAYGWNFIYGNTHFPYTPPSSLSAFSWLWLWFDDATENDLAPLYYRIGDPNDDGSFGFCDPDSPLPNIVPGDEMSLQVTGAGSGTRVICAINDNVLWDLYGTRLDDALVHACSSLAIPATYDVLPMGRRPGLGYYNFSHIGHTLPGNDLMGQMDNFSACSL